MQSIKPFMTTMTWADFRERFMRFFCPAYVREEQRWKLLNLVRGDRSVVEYTHEFFRLSRYATDVLQDIPRTVELYVFGLGPEFMVIRPEGRSLESVVEEARQVERRHIRHGTMPDPYQSGSVRPTQIAQQPIFQLANSDTQGTGPSQQNRHFRTRREGRHSAHMSSIATRFGSRGGSNTSG